MNLYSSNKLLDKIAELQNLLSQEKEKNRQLNLKINLLRSSTAYRIAHHIQLARADWRYAFRLPRIGFGFVMRSLRKSGRTPVSTVVPQKHKPLKAFDPKYVRSVESWLEKNREARSAQVIVYADMNLNVVDGSSIWLANVASMIGASTRCIIITKAPVTRDIIVGNIKNKHNVFILNHQDILKNNDVLSIKNAVELIRVFDNLMPNLRRVVVRGIDGAYELLSNRQFYGRSAIYLTNFYTTNEFGRLIDEARMEKLQHCLEQSAFLLTQTPFLEQELRSITTNDFQSIHLPPVIPDDLPLLNFRERRRNNSQPIKIGYAGKINSEWGVIELLDWTDALKSEGVSVELHIVADSIRNGPDAEHSNLKETIKPRLAAAGVFHYTGKNRADAIEIMASMDFVWCYRPPRLEDNTLELSTKLIEAVAMGSRCICFPNDINRDLLGEDYPFFVRDLAGLQSILLSESWAHTPETVIQRTKKRHGLEQVSTRFVRKLLPEPQTDLHSTVVFAGNDFKFIEAYISNLKARGHPAIRDQWEWGEPSDLEQSQRQMAAADIVFCEWGLANAVWYSNNLPMPKKLFVRVHAQEVRERARRFAKQIKWGRVEKFIFIADHIRDKAMELNDWPVEATELIPNYLFDDEFVLPKKADNGPIRLAMIGIVPQLKRFDRAVSLLKFLTASGHDVYLHIKGQRPENLPFMTVPARAKEMAWYNHIYDTINSDAHLSGRVVFEPWGNDVAQWLQKMDVILSCSDSEGSHQALGEGVLSGCYPILWPWEGADKVYKADWIVKDEYEAAARVVEYKRWSARKKQNEAVRNRKFIVERYGKEIIFDKLDELLFGSNTH